MSDDDKDSEKGSEIVRQDDFVLEEVEVEDGPENFLTGVSGVFENVQEEDDDDLFGDDVPMGLAEDTETGPPSKSQDDDDGTGSQMSEGSQPEDFSRDRGKTPQSIRPPVNDEYEDEHEKPRSGPGRGNGTGKPTGRDEIMSRLEAGVNREKEKAMTTEEENNSPDNETQNQKESEMDPNEAAAGQQEPPAELPDHTDDVEEVVTNEEGVAEDSDEGNDSREGLSKWWWVAAAVLLLGLIGLGYGIFGGDDATEDEAEQQIAEQSNTESEESNDSDLNVPATNNETGDEEEKSEESDETSKESEKAMADSDETENPDAEKESEAAKAAAGDLDGCQLKRRNGKDVGMLMNSEQNGVVLECDDGLYTVQARMRNGNVEVKTSTLQPFEGDEEDILFVKRSE